MAITPYTYGAAARTSIMNGEWNYLNSTIMAALLTSAATPSQDTHDYADDLTNELSGGGYARVEVTGKTAGYTAGTNIEKASCDPIVFPALTAADFQFVVVFADTGVDSVSPLISYFDLGGAQSDAGIDFTLTINAAGLFTIGMT